MQHHGAPTRLLDWTYSPYVAAFFAYDAYLHARGSQGPVAVGGGAEASAGGGERAGLVWDDRPVVWALHVGELWSALQRLLPEDDYRVLSRGDEDAHAFASVVDGDPPRSLVAPGNLHVLNTRLSVQQGVFLCPGDPTRPWLENLRALPWTVGSGTARAWVLDIEPGHVFEQLSRMNVTARSLFPGIDGFARSMLHRADLLMALDARRDPPA